MFLRLRSTIQVYFVHGHADQKVREKLTMTSQKTRSHQKSSKINNSRLLWVQAHKTVLKMTSACNLVVNMKSNNVKYKHLTDLEVT